MRNLILGGFNVSVKACQVQVGDHDLIELVTEVWAKAQDDPRLSDDQQWQTGYGDHGIEY